MIVTDHERKANTSDKTIFGIKITTIPDFKRVREKTPRKGDKGT